MARVYREQSEDLASERRNYIRSKKIDIDEDLAAEKRNYRSTGKYARRDDPDAPIRAARKLVQPRNISQHYDNGYGESESKYHGHTAHWQASYGGEQLGPGHQSLPTQAYGPRISPAQAYYGGDQGPVESGPRSHPAEAYSYGGLPAHGQPYYEGEQASSRKHRDCPPPQGWIPSGRRRSARPTHRSTHREPTLTAELDKLDLERTNFAATARLPEPTLTVTLDQLDLERTHFTATAPLRTKDTHRLGCSKRAGPVPKYGGRLPFAPEAPMTQGGIEYAARTKVEKKHEENLNESESDKESVTAHVDWYDGNDDYVCGY